MGFIKNGDPMPIKGTLERGTADAEALCPLCDAPLVTFAFDENGDAELICPCDHPEIMLESN